MEENSEKDLFNVHYNEYYNSCPKKRPYSVQQLNKAYLVPSVDAHNSEYLADCDQLRTFISGFDGSAGTAIITHDKGYMWTDGRYYLQASEQMDPNWILMKEGEPTTLKRAPWLVKNLPPGARIGVDPKLITYVDFNSLQKEIEVAGQKLVPLRQNLVELIWEDRPVRTLNPLTALNRKFSGMSVDEKLKKLVINMKSEKANYLVLTALDQIAWFLNLRGSDIKYNPVFFSYVIISSNGKFTWFINDKQANTPDVQDHLIQEAGDVFVIRPYEEIEDALKSISTTLNANEHVWFGEGSSYALISLIPKNKLVLTDITPVELMKAIKNPTEIKGLRNAHIKDAVALCRYFSWLERNVGNGKITEISGADQLHEFRTDEQDFVGESFSTISSVGPHGAIIHYSPDKTTDATLTTNQIYLCDSGSQFKDGTTDVTRTLHFGTPTEYEKECYTRVLKGQLKLGRTVFPSKIKGNHLDAFARQFLWEAGLDYGHGTGHGIGHYLNVHEGPAGISWRPIPTDPGLMLNMFLSNEPGYYEDGKFGMRIEDIVQIVLANTKNGNTGDKQFLTFETITLLPKNIKLINVDMLTQEEISQLNSYHKQVRDVIGPILKARGYADAFDWLIRETEPVSK